MRPIVERPRGFFHGLQSNFGLEFEGVAEILALTPDEAIPESEFQKCWRREKEANEKDAMPVTASGRAEAEKLAKLAREDGEMREREVARFALRQQLESWTDEQLRASVAGQRPGIFFTVNSAFNAFFLRASPSPLRIAVVGLTNVHPQMDTTILTRIKNFSFLLGKLDLASQPWKTNHGDRIRLQLTDDDLQDIAEALDNPEVSGRGKKKLLVITLHQPGAQHSFIASCLRISAPTLIAYLKEYRDGGLPTVLEDRYYRPSSILDPFWQCLICSFKAAPVANAKAAVVRIETMTGIRLSESQCRRRRWACP